MVVLNQDLMNINMTIFGLDGTWDDLTPINEVNHPKYIKIKKIDLERRINFNEIRSKNS